MTQMIHRTHRKVSMNRKRRTLRQKSKTLKKILKNCMNDIWKMRGESKAS